MIIPVSKLPVSESRFALRRADYDAGNTVVFRFSIENRDPEGAILHIRFPVDSPALSVIPDEAALAPGEKQTAVLTVNGQRAKESAKDAVVSFSVPVLCSYLRSTTPPVKSEGVLLVRLPVATCPNCAKIVADDDAHTGVPPVCPFCFERLRACPVCGMPNSWLARVCIADPSHVVRAQRDFGIAPGGDPSHRGVRPETRAGTALSRRWSFPTVAPARRESVLTFTAPVTAYGLVVVAVSDHDGEASLMAWDTLTGATLWESFPLEDPVYPERGSPSLAGGKLFVATVEGVCVCLDALRGTRVWETRLPENTQVFGAALPITLAGSTEGDATAAPNLILVPATLGAGRDTGAIFVLDAVTGGILRQIPLTGKTDTSPAYANGLGYAHDDNGILSTFDPTTGAIRWQATCSGGFDSAPVVCDNGVFSACGSGELFRHDAQTGELTWRLAVTNAPLSGTPACDGALLYVPADDGLHVVSATTGRAVRRFGARRPVRASPVVAANGTVFWGATDGAIYGVRGGGVAESLYEPGVPGVQIVAPLALADGALFAAATNGVLYVLEISG
ncbi:MAG: PQQ-binding-like beta-propeller repeat protein [Fibrella sp.]|nr:PQQ-binding-like beta-propeller repeat protein [Armatimonadota bacterium]